MADIDGSPCKSIYIDFHGKYRRYSGLLENTTKLKSKRFKTDEGEVADNLTKTNRKTYNLAFGEDEEISETKKISKTEIAGISSNVKYNLNLIDDHKKILIQSPLNPKARGRSRKDKNSKTEKGEEKNNQKAKVSSKIRPKPKVKKEQISSNAALSNTKEYTENESFKTPRTQKPDKINFNIAFVEEKKEIPKMKPGERERKQRRLSGIYKPDLNTGFIEQPELFDEEIFLAKQEIPFVHVFGEAGNSKGRKLLSSENTQEYSALEELDKKENNNATPVKSKLRRRPKKQDTEEEIIKYYTDKTIKKKQNTLETIFETPKPEPMSVKKYKRFINFNERMSTVKIKKRCSKIVKYNLWQNTDPVSMDYFVRKIEEVEKDL